MARPQTIFSELHLALSVAGTDKPRLIENVDKDIELVYQKEYAKRIKDKPQRHQREASLPWHIKALASDW